MAEPIEISSDDTMEDFDSHFRVFAGPGAGKTHWLINHIINVAKKSKVMSSTRKIACITYTNVAANQIKEKLGDYVDRVDVSTIHSFLYRNVVKPYLHVIVDAEGEPLVDFARVDGHDEHYPDRGLIIEWLKSTGQWGTLASKLNECAGYFKKLKWIQSDSLDWEFKTIGFPSRPKFLPTTKITEYKELYWKRGIIDHEDVLYFAYRILNENPQLRVFLASKFPYIYVDEFQDTNPIQTQIIKWLGESDSHIGIIGDLEQSIYSFQGAKPEYFKDFELPDIRDYKIAGNRRSTAEIVKVLNDIRSDGLKQRSLTGNEGLPVEIHVGGLDIILKNIHDILGGDGNLAILARKNIEVQNIRRKQYATASAIDIWQDFRDSDSARARFVETIIISVELFRRGQCTESLKKLIKVLSVKRNGSYRKPLKCNSIKLSKIQSRGIAISVINETINKYDDLQNISLLDFYNWLSGFLKQCLPEMSLTRFIKGAIKDFAEKTALSDLINSVVLSGSETRNVRTIHQAKGAQFNNVLVSLDHMDIELASKRLALIFNGSPSENKRILYVAMSRARKRLFIAMPAITPESNRKASDKGYKVVVH